MRARSKKFAAQQRKRVKLVASMLEEDGRCHMRARIHTVDPDYRDCSGQASALHELRKRSAGGSILNPDNCVRSCDPCNEWVESYPTLARSCGLVIRAGDPGFDDLGTDPGPRNEEESDA